MPSATRELLAFALILYLGLSAFFFGYHRYLQRSLGQSIEIPGQWGLYAALALHMAALGLFAVGGYKLRINDTVTLALFFYFTSHAVLAVCFRQIRLYPEKLFGEHGGILIIAGVVVFATIRLAPFHIAFTFGAAFFVLILGWVLYEIRALSRLQESFPLRICYVIVAMKFLLMAAVLVKAGLDWAPERFADAQAGGGFLLFRVVREALSLILYIATMAYLLERLAAERTAQTKYVEEIRPLLDQRDSLSSALVVANKVSSVGALASTLTHEIRQPVASLQINADMLAMKIQQAGADTAGLSSLVDRISGGVGRLTAVAESVERLFLGPVEAEGVSPDPEIEDIVAALGRGPEWAGVQFQLSLGGVDDVAMSTSHFRLLVLNLLNNANAAFGRSKQHDRTIRISSRAQGRAVEVVVEDNGPGIAPALAANLFGLKEPESGGGMGLGLWVIHHIVERYGGKIRCDSVPGHGAKFQMTLPTRSP